MTKASAREREIKRQAKVRRQLHKRSSRSHSAVVANAERQYTLGEGTKYMLSFLSAGVPERSNELKGIVKESKITFRKEVGSGAVRVNLKSKRVSVGTDYLRQLWAHSYGSYVLYFELATFDNSNRDGNVLNLDESQRCRTALEFLKYSLGLDSEVSLTNDGEFRMRTQSAIRLKPFARSPNLEVRLVDQIVQIGLSLVLQHELAHVYLGQSGLPSREDEEEADSAALDWVFGLVSKDRKVMASRKMATFITMLFVLTQEFHFARKRKPSIHPPAQLRLYRTLARHLDDDEQIWQLAYYSLRLHLQLGGVEPPLASPANSYRQLAEIYFDEMEKARARGADGPDHRLSGRRGTSMNA